MHQLHHGALAAGSHQVVVAADGLASGVYLARLVVGGAAATRAVTLVR